MAGARALLIVLVAAVALVAAPPMVAAAEGSSAVAEICKSTAFPELCTRTAGRHAEKYLTVDAVTVLEMQVEAFTKRSFYQDAADNLGACKRAIGFRDAVTIRATMSMAQQDMQNCDEMFRQAGTKNPMEDINQSLVEMSEICRSLSNMVPAELSFH
ncbi:hypothetical protein BS78_K097600 [Paspalum vaginatum]|uniref:Pectinesterase inhibitor domain-containing protein n=1 Tax=Paspalum vaginatum TaxID=158149 RepID=A0A9W7X8A7_9POAL|nr:hypothetical protein BS78_K097600 [Paspalum vaginatum]